MHPTVVNVRMIGFIDSFHFYTVINLFHTFEAFCILFLQSKGYQAWLLKDVPDHILTEFGMNRGYGFASKK